MSFLAQINWLYSLSGFFVGVLVGLTGVGGGSLMTPLLVLLFGIYMLVDGVVAGAINRVPGECEKGLAM